MEDLIAEHDPAHTFKKYQDMDKTIKKIADEYDAEGSFIEYLPSLAHNFQM